MATARVEPPVADAPPEHRPEAELTVLDITKYFAATAGGIRTYLTEKARYVQAHPWLRQVLVVPDEIGRAHV